MSASSTTVKLQSNLIAELQNQKTALQDKLRALVGDIEAMRCEPPYDFKQLGVPEENEHWFGGFGNVGFEGDSSEEMSFQWPNLGILADEAKALLK